MSWENDSWLAFTLAMAIQDYEDERVAVERRSRASQKLGEEIAQIMEDIINLLEPQMGYIDSQEVFDTLAEGIGYIPLYCFYSVINKEKKATKEQTAIIKLFFNNLTKLLDQMNDGPYGEWIVDTENDGSPEHPRHFPFVRFQNDVVYELIHTISNYAENGHDYLYRYDETIQAGGVDIRRTPLKDVDVSSLDGKTVLAMLMMAIREDRFCEGALLEYFENGSIRKWLMRLREIDQC